MINKEFYLDHILTTAKIKVDSINNNLDKCVKLVHKLKVIKQNTEKFEFDDEFYIFVGDRNIRCTREVYYTEINTIEKHLYEAVKRLGRNINDKELVNYGERYLTEFIENGGVKYIPTKNINDSFIVFLAKQNTPVHVP